MAFTSAPTTPASAAARDYNTGYLKTPAGMLRLAEGLVALAAIISCAEGAVCLNDGSYGYFIFVAVISLIHSILILLGIILQFEKKITVINIPLTLLINDSIRIVAYFVATVLMMLAIGKCQHMMVARIFTSLFGIAGFLILVGLSYTDYKWWIGEETPYSRPTEQTNGIPVTASSPTVLVLS